jgi:hypothetical protein
MTDHETNTYEPLTVPVALVKIEALIADPKHWVKGKTKGLNSEGGVCYCLIGAIQAICGNQTMKVYAVVHKALPCESAICDFNDHFDTTHADIMNVIKKAKELAGETE